MSVLVSAIILKAKQYSDKVNSSHVDDPEWLEYCGDALYNLYDELVLKVEDYFVNDPTAFTLTSAQSSFDLPADFYKLRGLDRQVAASNEFYPVVPFNFEQRNRFYQSERIRGVYAQVMYRLIGNKLKMIPEDNVAGEYRLWYVPLLTRPTDETDAVTWLCQGWERYVALDMAIVALDKEESDTTALQIRLAREWKRIKTMAKSRDHGRAATVTDVSRSGYDDISFYR